MDLEGLYIVYNNLREEIVKRIEIEHQVISISLVALGAILTIGLTNTNVTFLLLYPILVMFLASTWCDNNLRIGEISAYIKEEIAPKVGTNIIGWELAQKKFYSYPYGFRHSILTVLGKRGVFLGSQLAVIVLAITKIPHPDTTQCVFFSIAILVTLITAVILLGVARPVRNMPS